MSIRNVIIKLFTYFKRLDRYPIDTYEPNTVEPRYLKVSVHQNFFSVPIIHLHILNCLSNSKFCYI